MCAAYLERFYPVWLFSPDQCPKKVGRLRKQYAFFKFLWPQSHLIPGLLCEFDLDDLYRLLAERCDFRLSDPWDGFFQSAE